MTPVPECRQIKRDGLRCQSPALRGRSHCYFHGPTPPQPRPRSAGFTLPAVHNFETLQAALGQFLHAVASSQLTDRRAKLLLATLELTARTLTD